MKTFNDLKEGEYLYLYYKGVLYIEKVLVKKIVYTKEPFGMNIDLFNPRVHKSTFKLYGTVNPKSTSHGNHYTTLIEAETQFKKDIKSEIKELQKVKNKVKQSVDSKISKLKLLLQEYK